MFGQHSPSSAAQALSAYQEWVDVWYGGGPDLDASLNGAAHVRRREDDRVPRECWRSGGVPFSDDANGNAHAVDLPPAPGATLGQVVTVGSDEDLRRVLAPSIAAILADDAARLPPRWPIPDPILRRGEPLGVQPHSPAGGPSPTSSTRATLLDGEPKRLAIKHRRRA